MRFKAGDKVEVMNNKEVPVSWCTAEILSRSDNTYTIQYDCYPGMASKQLVKMVSRKFVRPCAPLLPDVMSFITGDIVEVFHQHSWKLAIVLGDKKEKRDKIRCKASTLKNQYLVKLLECSKELLIDRSSIRMRQIWHDGKWVPMGKIHHVGHDIIVRKPSTSNCCQKMNIQIPQFNSSTKYQHGEDFRNIQNDAALRESAVISSRSLKRMPPYGSSVIEANNGHAQKFRAAEKDGQKQRVVAYLEKVDAAAYPRETLGETYMHASFNVNSNGYNQMEREKQNDVPGCSGIRGTETLCSDAESSYVSGTERKNSSLPLKDEVEVSLRSLELHAYRSTLRALYASGPLSWEQEALLTNLRIVLHISNDQHLKELKLLFSAKTALTLR